MVTVQMDSPMQMVKLLKGAPLAVLMLLNIAQRAGQGLVGAEWLATLPTHEAMFQFRNKGFNTLVAETLTKISGRKIGFICFGTH